MTAASDDTGTFTVPGSLDAELRHDLVSAAWLLAAVTLPGLAVLALLVS